MSQEPHNHEPHNPTIHDGENWLTASWSSDNLQDDPTSIADTTEHLNNADALSNALTSRKAFANQIITQDCIGQVAMEKHRSNELNINDYDADDEFEDEHELKKSWGRLSLAEKMQHNPVRAEAELAKPIAAQGAPNLSGSTVLKETPKKSQDAKKIGISSAIIATALIALPILTTTPALAALPSLFAIVAIIAGADAIRRYMRGKRQSKVAEMKTVFNEQGTLLQAEPDALSPDAAGYISQDDSPSSDEEAENQPRGVA